LNLLFELALLCAVILHAALNRTPLAVRISAPKRTTKVCAPGVTWMSQEEDPAMPTTGQASPQVGFGPQCGSQDTVVLQHESKYFAPAIPIRAELKVLLDSYSKKPRLSLMILMCLGMSSSYTIDTSCVER
jgi:hypothetical protein